MVKVAINGFGRIGRAVLKIALEWRDIKIVAINDLSDISVLAHLLQYDTNYGTYEHKVSYSNNELIIDSERIPVFSESNPTLLPWSALGVDVVIDCSDCCHDPKVARKHIDAGAKKIVVGAPFKDDSDIVKTIVLGVNEETVNSKDILISNASCTTNCVAPIMSLLEEKFGIAKSMITSIHSYTASQSLIDKALPDLRQARSAGNNIIPAMTDIDNTIGAVIPSLKGKTKSIDVRVPTPIVSLADITVLAKQKVKAKDINEIFKLAAQEPYYQGILGVTEEPLVSSDFRGSSYSCIIDLSLTKVVEGDLVKIMAWYDNEWGYANRLVELAVDRSESNSDKINIYVGSDSSNNKIKHVMTGYLKDAFDNIGVVDIEGGNTSNVLATALKVTKSVLNDPSYSYGILISQQASRVCSRLNRIKNIRAISPSNFEMAKFGRQNNSSNLLCLSPNDLSFSTMRDIIRTFFLSLPNPHLDKEGRS